MKTADPPSPKVSPAPKKGAIITKVPGENLIDYFTGRRVLCLPEGVELASWWIERSYSHAGRILEAVLCLKVEHESFPPTEPGRKYPDIQVQSATVRYVELRPRPKAASKAKVLLHTQIERRIVMREVQRD